MEDIILDSENVDTNVFSNIQIQRPIPLNNSGNYLAKLTINDNPIIFQTSKSKTKKGIIHNKNKKGYCDLLFENVNPKFYDWINELENKVKGKIFEKRDIWFHDPPTLDDIDYNWIESIKQYKKNYSFRTFLGKSNDINDVLSIFDSDQNKCDINSIKPDTNIITIIEVTGLKFSSSSFHLEYCLRQVMILKEIPLFQKCFIKINSS